MTANFRAKNIVSKSILKLMLTLSVVIITAQASVADPRTAADARQVAQGWLKTVDNPLDTPLGKDVASVESFGTTNNAPDYYVVYLKPQGFVIVPADDWLYPIKSFAPQGRYDPSPDNPLGALLASDVPPRLKHLRRLQALGGAIPRLCQQHADAWRTLQAVAVGAVPVGFTPGADLRVVPLIQSLWSQGKEGNSLVYNFFTPLNWPCGCVATAMAQLMRYWQYPHEGIGVKTFDIKVNGEARTRSTLGGDGVGGAYRWDLMPLVPTESSSEMERMEIGALCHDAGVAVHADYGEDETSAYVSDIAPALKDVFDFYQALCGHNKNWSDIGAGLVGMINPSLDAGLPVLLSIHGTGSHMVVCDGYGYYTLDPRFTTMYHHLNFGWGAAWAAYNYWYALPDVNDDYYTVNGCIYNIFPADRSGWIISGRVLDSAGNPVAGAAVVAVRVNTAGDPLTDRISTATANERGIYALTGISSNRNYTISARKNGYCFPDQIVETDNSQDGEATAANLWAINFTSVLQAAPADYDGDGKADQALYSDATGTWTIRYSSGSTATFQFGGMGCMPVSADYDGDGRADPALYYPMGGLWGIMLSSQGYAATVFSFGDAGWTPAVADYDGDSRADPALYSETIGLWLVPCSSYGYALMTMLLGGQGYLPAPADYDGDSKADPAVYFHLVGQWQELLSASGYAAVIKDLGNIEYQRAVPADYDGDRKADPAVYCEHLGGAATNNDVGEMNGNWCAAMSSRTNETLYQKNLGAIGWLPASADYDGDRLADPAVYNVTNGSWRIRSIADWINPLLTNAMCYFPLDGNTNDGIGSFPITVNVNGNSYVAGKINQGWSSANNAYFMIYPQDGHWGEFTATNYFTTAWWMKFDSLPSSKTGMFFYGGASVFYVDISITPSGALALSGDNSSWNNSYTSPDIISTGQWYHMITEWSDSGGAANDVFSFFLNGTRLWSTTYADNKIPWISLNFTPSFMDQESVAHVNAVLDEIYLLDRPLTAAEIQRISKP